MNATCQRARISGPKRCRRKASVERMTSHGRIALCHDCDKARMKARYV